MAVEELITKIIEQAPVIGVLVFLFYRNEARFDRVVELMLKLCDDDDESQEHE